MPGFFDTSIEFLKGIGPQRAEALKKELSIHTYGQLLQFYPFRYEDRSKIWQISELREDLPFIQLVGKIRNLSAVSTGRAKRLVATFSDGTGSIELVWFQGLKFITQKIKPQYDYIIYGKPNVFKGQYSLVHPEMEVFTGEIEEKGLQPVYHSTEKLKKRYIDSRFFAKVMRNVVEPGLPHIQENLPEEVLWKHDLESKPFAVKNIHFPKDVEHLDKAKKRLKFEELFYVQLRLLSQKLVNKATYKGLVFKSTGLLTEFYKDHLPFDLTDAQKRVVKEIYKDMCTGKQMNRLLQGDVGSGKTIVGFICMLLAIENGAQACLMAPTEILADQHFRGLKEFADKLELPIAKLTGSTKASERKQIHAGLLSGELKIVVGTHALLEEVVQFHNLGLVVIDEQHRFGVAQRAKLWKKNRKVHPHVLVMTATPIPRTLAMTLYGDLDVSVIDELPAGRKPIQTVHRYDKDRLKVFEFLRSEISKGRQAYIVYPLIEESATLDLKNLSEGYDIVRKFFKEFKTCMVHGKMKPAEKDAQMQKFLNKEAHIMVATTVIEVGVNVPNASVMVIENAERFGLSQLHQLRGRVGRGAEQSFCILMTGYKLSSDSRTRLSTMVRTNNGFEIADTDLKLRGPGDMAGTKQSGDVEFLIADLSQDARLLQEAREAAEEILDNDPHFQNSENINIRRYLASLPKSQVAWSRIS
ncbi:ATP-dependent DNA helicase RecG [Cytophagaceae bacterium ABcell3]|nr:ATP-dependent DNA helicase RecG [Cytophagaceae bacterium ABcell3]